MRTAIPAPSEQGYLVRKLHPAISSLRLSRQSGFITTEPCKKLRHLYTCLNQTGVWRNRKILWANISNYNMDVVIYKYSHASELNSRAWKHPSIAALCKQYIKKNNSRNIALLHLKNPVWYEEQRFQIPKQWRQLINGQNPNFSRQIKSEPYIPCMIWC